MNITSLEYENLKAELRRTIERYGLNEVTEALRTLAILEGYNGKMPTFF